MQITQMDNRLDAVLGNQLDTDLTGDGAADFSIAGFTNTMTASNWRVSVTFTPDVMGTMVKAWASATNNKASGFVNGVNFAAPVTAVTASTVFAVAGSDVLNTAGGQINGGVAQPFIIEFTVSAVKGTSAAVTIDRIIFDDAGGSIFGYDGSNYTEYVGVPEPGGFALGLLAMGASGVLRRRRSRQG